jgi:hypothetical protein
MLLAGGAAVIADQLSGWHPRGWDGGFLAHLHSPWGYDEPEFLRYSNRQLGPLRTDDRHAKNHDDGSKLPLAEWLRLARE